MTGPCPAGDRCGTNTGATRWGGRKAGCPHCITAARRYGKQREYRRATQGPAYVDATPARDHLHHLVAQGKGAKAKGGKGGYWFFAPAKQLGLSSDQLRRIMSGDIKRVWPSTLDKILSLSLDHHDTAGRWRDCRTADGLISALEDKGWTRGGIAKALGCATRKLQAGTRGAKVHVDTLAKLRQLLADHDRPPAEYVREPYGGWDAWWNRRPEHPGPRLHHTRRGCRRRGCEHPECVEAHRIYDTALRVGVEAVEPLVLGAVEAQRLRVRDLRRLREWRAQADDQVEAAA